MYLIVFIHELGHVITASIFGWKIKKINIYPFGGYTIFDTTINKRRYEEVLVAVSGVLFQIILYILFKNIINDNLYIYSLFCYYNTTIILFNIIPIYILDGGKIINIIINNIFPFKYAHLISIYISYITIIVLIVFNINNVNMIAMVIILLVLVIKEHKNHLYIFNAFLLDRYFNKVHYKKNNIVVGDNINRFMKYLNNVFIIDNNYIDEYYFLMKRYK